QEQAETREDRARSKPTSAHPLPHSSPAGADEQAPAACAERRSALAGRGLLVLLGLTVALGRSVALPRAAAVVGGVEPRALEVDRNRVEHLRQRRRAAHLADLRIRIADPV